MRVGVDRNPFKHRGITKSAVQLPVQHRSEIDLLLRSIVESNVQHEGLDDLERRDAMDGKRTTFVAGTSCHRRPGGGPPATSNTSFMPDSRCSAM